MSTGIQAELKAGSATWVTVGASLQDDLDGIDRVR